MHLNSIELVKFSLLIIEISFIRYLLEFYQQFYDPYSNCNKVFICKTSSKFQTKTGSIRTLHTFAREINYYATKLGGFCSVYALIDGKYYACKMPIGTYWTLLFVRVTIAKQLLKKELNNLIKINKP